MSSTAKHNASPDFSAWDAHLSQQLNAKEWAYTFDMDDGSEATLLAQFPHLASALDFLNKEVTPAYQKADKAAVAHQKNHRWLAGVAIIGGGTAIGLAILQLALMRCLPGWTVAVAMIEAVAVVCGVTAVAVGLIAKFNCQWFIQRHIAERMRMLKFQSLGHSEFWSGDKDGWEKWVRARRDSITELATLHPTAALKLVKSWARSGDAEPFEPAPPACPLGEENTRAAAMYYRSKRADFQKGYFIKQSGKFSTETRLLHRIAFPIFVCSIVAAVFHFGADLIAHQAKTPSHFMEIASVWALALAAILPVVGFVVRAWIGAFERIRSAHSYEAKHHALEKCTKDMRRDEADCAATMHHIAHVEHFLEHEHREWLRLLLDAEWFL